MTRGRPPARALALATGIAERRGEVQYFLQAPGLICNFVIYLAGLVAHVRVMRVRHLRCTLAWLEREVGDALAGLRMIASSPAISRELWICSPRGIFRFFRIGNSGLEELDRDGRVLPEEKLFTLKSDTTSQPAPGAGTKAPAPAFTGILDPAPESPGRKPDPAARVPTVNSGNSSHASGMRTRFFPGFGRRLENPGLFIPGAGLPGRAQDSPDRSGEDHGDVHSGISVSGADSSFSPVSAGVRSRA